MRRLFNDELGFVVSSELVLVLTIAVLGMVVGLTAVRDSMSQEMVDVSSAFGTVNQTFNVVGVSKNKSSGKAHAAATGFGFNDKADDCDCQGLTLTDVCGKPDSSNGAANEGNDGGNGGRGHTSKPGHHW